MRGLATQPAELSEASPQPTTTPTARHRFLLPLPSSALTEKIKAHFWSRVMKRDDECWTWTKGNNGNGYGRLCVWIPETKSRRTLSAHRVSYMLAHGDIPPGYQIDHICGHHWCVNPDHLEAVTFAENMRRYSLVVRPLRNKCRRGHDRTEDNLYGKPGDKSRACKKCVRLYTQGYYWRKKFGLVKSRAA